MSFERDVYVYGEVRAEASEPKPDGTKRMPRLSEDGSFVTQDWLTAMLNEGRVFQTNAGLISAVVASAGAISAVAPDIYIQIPATVIVIPIAASITVDSLTDDQDIEILGLISNGVDTTPTGGSDLAIYNRNQASGRGSQCDAKSDVSAITSPVTGRKPQEFWRDHAELGAKPEAGSSEEGQRTTFKYNYLTDGPVKAAGGAELCLYLGVAATNYQATIVWVELDA